MLAVLGTLWILAGLLILWTALPPLLALLGMTRHYARCDADPTRVAVENWNDPDEAFIHEQLSLLGMEPLGNVDEEIWFLAVHWFKRIPIKVLGSDEHNCFACLYRLFPNDPLRISLATCFEDGCLVWTGNYLEDFKKIDSKYIRSGIRTDDVAELLRQHQKAVAAVRTEGHALGRHDDITTLARTMSSSGAKHLRMPALHFNFLLAALALPAVGYWFAGERFEAIPWMTPVGVLAGSVAWLIFFYCCLINMAKDQIIEPQEQSPALR